MASKNQRVAKILSQLTCQEIQENLLPLIANRSLNLSVNLYDKILTWIISFFEENALSMVRKESINDDSKKESNSIKEFMLAKENVIHLYFQSRVDCFLQKEM